MKEWFNHHSHCQNIHFQSQNCCFEELTKLLESWYLLRNSCFSLHNRQTMQRRKYTRGHQHPTSWQTDKTRPNNCKTCGKSTPSEFWSLNWKEWKKRWKEWTKRISTIPSLWLKLNCQCKAFDSMGCQRWAWQPTVKIWPIKDTIMWICLIQAMYYGTALYYL